MARARRRWNRGLWAARAGVVRLVRGRAGVVWVVGCRREARRNCVGGGVGRGSVRRKRRRRRRRCYFVGSGVACCWVGGGWLSVWVGSVIGRGGHRGRVGVRRRRWWRVSFSGFYAGCCVV